MQSDTVQSSESTRWTGAIPGFALNFQPPRLVLAGEAVEFEWRPVGSPAGRRREFVARNRFGLWRWQCSEISDESGNPGFRIEFARDSQNTSAPVADWELTLFTMDELPCDHLLAQGSSMGNCLSLETDRHREREFRGYAQLLLRRKRQFLQLAMAPETPGDAFFSGTVTHGCLHHLTANVREVIARNATFPVISMEIFSGPDGHALMDHYAKRHAGCRPVRPPRDSGCGWNSWDYYRWTITAEEVLANAEFIARDPVLSQHVKRIVIDDGWMHCYGEWEANSRFPGGMGVIARELRKMGFLPGLWFAPGIAEPQSMVAQQHWDYLACGVSGLPCLGFECMSRRGFLLDPTRPEVTRMLYDLFRRYRELGFGYFKLDFLSHTLNARRFADGAASGHEIIRRLLAPIATGAGDDAELLGCNYPFAAGSGLVDTVRIACDIHARRDAMATNSVSIAARSWTQPSWWRNDPDFALIRGPATSDDPDLAQLRPAHVYVTPEGRDDAAFGNYTIAGELGFEEIKVLLGIVLMSGGAINFSDCFPRLNARGVALARQLAAAPPGEAARVLDLFEHEQPERWRQKVTPTHFRLLLVNWSDADREYSLEPEDCGFAGRIPATVTDFWDGTPITAAAILLPGHSSRLLEWRFPPESGDNRA